MQTLSFTVAAVQADASKVKLPGGAVSQKLAEAASGANSGFVSAITPGTQLTNIVLFIDTNQQSVNNVAATKWGSGGALFVWLHIALLPFTIFCACLWQLGQCRSCVALKPEFAWPVLLDRRHLVVTAAVWCTCLTRICIACRLFPTQLLPGLQQRMGFLQQQQQCATHLCVIVHSTNDGVLLARACIAVPG